MDVNRDKWSGEGNFTEELLAWLSSRSDIVFVRVEDASSTRTDVDYNFISNEVYVQFRVCERLDQHRFLGIIPVRRIVLEKTMTLSQLDTTLASESELGTSDYADEGMIQYLHTERMIPHYQTKGYKLIELVRIYEVGAESRA